MTLSKLHITMNILLRDSGDYLTDFVAGSPAVIAVTTLYTDKQSLSVAAVLLPEHKRSMYKLDAVPHISLFKLYDVRWKDVGHKIKCAVSCTDYGPCCGM